MNLRYTYQEEIKRGVLQLIWQPRGFTFLAELLLSSSCPLEDAGGNTVFSYTKQSKVDSARAWGNEMELPLRLEKDMEAFLPLLSINASSLQITNVHFGESVP